MAQRVLTQSKLYAAGYDFSGDLKSIALKVGADQLDNTSFASGGAHSRVAGLMTGSFSLAGYWNALIAAAAADDTLFANIGLTGVPVTIVPQTGAEGEPSYILNADFADYAPSGKVGELFG